MSGRMQRRRRYRRSVEPKEDEEIELLQEVLKRRLKNNNSEASAQSNRALLERLLMKNAHSGFEDRRRAWSANPAPTRPVASRSVGGTPICLRRRFSRPRKKLIFERNHQIHPTESSSSLQNASASELALMEADREADLKYTQLIMEAERMLLNAQQQLDDESPVETPSPRLPRGHCRKQRTALNRRVELIKNAELNAELAISKSRNSQPELSSGSIKDLYDHSSPKRLLQQQQKKIIDPVVSQTTVPKQTVDNSLSTFQSIDVKPAAILLSTGCTNESTSGYSCPQSEPVKRKVYESQNGSGRMLQRQAAPWLRNSDGDCANEQQQQQQHQQHQSQLQSSSATSSYSQLRKHMLIETLQGLKQSLEDQSAALKMNCLRPL
ncbi:PREDICTED: uncharacterized protein LOC105363317 [Ceratosolen solmsi marchali]|uniref:Uncharacterized protein LOC105363317 n=1 Tax=Ceratosolen solmsi marchali TaxID=326594 RepID=A0AAJ6YJN3_9HYME|nr:PREDICTED: uncharacterized protein LOC105363317 [Ceratosolen solmsi marchali]